MSPVPQNAAGIGFEDKILSIASIDVCLDIFGLGGWLCRMLDLVDLEGTGPGRGRVATPGVCIIERRRIGGCREISELVREMGALSG